jgi:hypothetical protein
MTRVGAACQPIDRHTVRETYITCSHTKAEKQHEAHKPTKTAPEASTEELDSCAQLPQSPSQGEFRLQRYQNASQRITGELKMHAHQVLVFPT